MVFMDISIGEFHAGRVTFELFADTNPWTAENFRCLCTGEKGLGRCGKALHYKGCEFHRILQDFVVQGGDFVNGDGTGGEAVFGGVDGRLPDEAMIHRHTREGLLAMANDGRRHTSSSQFYVTLRAAPHLDSRHVVFGQVIEGFEVFLLIGRNGTPLGRPRDRVTIRDCGQIFLRPGGRPRSLESASGLRRRPVAGTGTDSRPHTVSASASALGAFRPFHDHASQALTPASRSSHFRRLEGEQQVGGVGMDLALARRRSKIEERAHANGAPKPRPPLRRSALLPT